MALKEIRKQIADHRILLKPQFQDFDKAKSCHISAQQFSRVLKKLNLIPSNDFAFELIVRRFADKGNIKEINYFQFCRDVDRPEDMFPLYVPKKEVPQATSLHPFSGPSNTFFDQSTKDLNVIESRFSQKPVNIANDPNDVEQRIQALVVMKRIRIEEFFRDFDKLRKGKVTIP